MYRGGRIIPERGDSYRRQWNGCLRGSVRGIRENRSIWSWKWLIKLSDTFKVLYGGVMGDLYPRVGNKSWAMSWV